MNKDREFSFTAEVEGEEARSETLTIAKDLKKCDILEFADIHFNHDSAVLLPQRYPENEENETKLKALDAIVCCYLFAMENPSKLMLIAGHCDRSGNPPYNEWLAQRRAENILNVMLGNRDEWVKSVTTSSGPIRTKKDGKPDGKSKHEDYQMILKWIAEEFKWSCDPGDVEDKLPCNPSDTKTAVEAFQESWNDDSKLRSYVNASPIKVDGRMGPETWGAFFDIFMIKLADKLELHSDTSRLGTYRKACKFIDANRKTLSCGESHVHDSQDISLEDRRVYIMFFDPNEVPKLADYPDCHKGVGDMTLGDTKKPKGAERSEECELFRTKSPYTMNRVTCPRPRSPFLILYPALGLPAIANDGTIDVLALVENEWLAIAKQTLDNDQEIIQLLKDAIVRSIRYVRWSDKDDTTSAPGKRLQISFGDKNVKKLQVDWVTDPKWIRMKRETVPANVKEKEEELKYKKIELIDEDDESDSTESNDEKRKFLCPHQLSLRVSELAFTQDVYGAKYEISKVLWFHVKLPDSDGLYNLVNQFDESNFVRNILKGLKSTGYFSEKTETTIKKGSEIIVYHPFLITKKDLLSIAHVTDVHASTLWTKLEDIVKKNRVMKDGDFNNYNTRFEDILKDLSSTGPNNGQADILVVTGDLVDYNRGYVEPCRCGSPSNHFSNDYLFNRNWVLFYELLVENCDKPVFTVIGNHEYLLNPYPLFVDPTVTAQKIPITWLLSFVLNKRLTQSPFAVDQNLTRDETEKLAKLVNSVENVTLTFTDALNLLGGMADHKEDELGKFVENNSTARSKFYDQNGIWYSCEKCALWYFLVINPFKDYAFSHKEMAFLMVDWNVFQDKRDVFLLPRPTKCLVGDGMKMVDDLTMREAKYRIFCCHAPIIDPWPELGDFYMIKARMKKDNDEIEDYPILEPFSEKFNWGALEESSRQALINKILSKSSPIHLCLCGHSHKNKVFQVEEVNNQRRAFLRKEDKKGQNWEKWDSKLPVIMVTTSAGPFGRTNEVSEWEYADLIQPGYRLISFDANGQISTKLVNISKVLIRDSVRQDKDLMKNDYGKVAHDIDKFVTFGPSTGLKPDHSAIIEEAAGNPSITKLNEGRAIVIKMIPSGVNLTIEGNFGTVVAQRNEGNLIVKNNYGKVNVDENVGKVTVQENAHTVVIHENGDPTRPGSGTVEIIDNGKFFPLSRTPIPIFGVLFTPRTAELRIYNNFETVKINNNTDWIEFGINKGTIEIVKNPNRWIQKDPRIFIYRNEKNVTIHENGGKIYIFDNSKGTLDVKNNSDIITVSTSKIGNRTGAGANTINKEPLSDAALKALFEGKATGEPKIDDAKPGP